jgi:hypothetical protein
MVYIGAETIERGITISFEGFTAIGKSNSKVERPKFCALIQWIEIAFDHAADS